MKNFTFLLLMVISLSTFGQKVTNTWDGSFNSYWHNNGNWSLGHIPTATEDVVIPNGMPRYPSVDFYDEEIKSLTIHSNAEVRIYDHIFKVTGDVIIYGALKILHADARLECNDISWESGSEAQTIGNCDIMVFGTWEFKVGANVQLDEGRAWFYGSNDQYIRSKDADCYFNDIYVQKDGGVFALSGQSSATCKIKGSFVMSGSNYNFLSYSSQSIQIGKYLLNGNPGINIALDMGTIEITDYPINFIFKPQPGDYINNLVVNSGTYDLDFSPTYTSIFEIKGDVTINSGRLDANGMNLLVGGNWDNNVGLSGFVERDEKVTFNGSGHQYCSDETFYTLEIDKPSGALRMQGSDVVCAEYDWTDGAIDVLSGSFTANGLLDAGIAGEWYVNDEVHIHQNVGYIDLLGDLHIFDGGYMHVYGGSGDSYWPYGASGSHFEIETGASLKFYDVGINIRPTGTLTTDITGGWIGMAGDFKIDRADFYAPVAIWAMQGITDTEVEIIQGQINQLDIAKQNGKASKENLNKNIPEHAMHVFDTKKYSKSKYVSTGIYTTGFNGRDGKVHSPTRANTVSVSANFSLQNMNIYGGTFDLNGHTANISGDMVVHDGGILKMTNPLDELNLRNLEWRSGSADLITKGEINVSRYWTFKAGTEAHLGSDNTVRFTGGGFSSIYNYDDDAFFGSIALQKNAGSSVYLHELSTYPIHCVGDFSIENNNNFYPQTKTLIVDGILDIQNGSAIYLEDEGGQLINNSDMDLTGKIEVLDGCEATINGKFGIYPTGELIIGGGTFIVESNYWSGIYGSLILTDGLLDFRNSIFVDQNASTAISGGLFKVEHSFDAKWPGTFEPTGGTVEFYTESLSSIECTNGNFFYNLDINDCNSAFPVADLLVANDLNIHTGIFNVMGHTVEVANNVRIYGTLKMTNSLGVLECGNRIYWKPGSDDNITAGNIYSASWTFEEGTNAMLGTGNTVHLSSGNSPYDPDAEFGNLVMGSWSKSGTPTKNQAEGGIGKTPHSVEGSFALAPIDGKTVYPRRVAGNCTNLPGSGWISYNDIIVQGTLDIQDGASQTLYSDNTITTYSDFTLNGELDLNTQGNAYVEGAFEIATTGELIIEGGEFIVENSSPSYNDIYGTMTMTDGLFWIDHNIRFFEAATANISGGMIRSSGLYATFPGTFLPTGGTVEIQTLNNSYGGIHCINGNYLYNLNVNRGGSDGGAHLYEDILVSHDVNILLGKLWLEGKTATVQGNTTIHDGGLRMLNSTDVLNAGDDPTDEIRWTSDATLKKNEMGRINVFGNCTIENGVNDSISEGQTLAFVGTGDQNLENYSIAMFGTIELDKPSGELIIPKDSEVTCQSYDWTSGTFTLDGGNFTANDLVDEGLFGTYNFNSGEAWFTQDPAQLPDMNGIFNISGASVNIQGGGGMAWFAHGADAELNMNSGELNFIDNGVSFAQQSNNFTENITGGTLRTNGDFILGRWDFAPTGGEIELTGSSQTVIEAGQGSTLHHLVINKDGSDRGMVPITNSKGERMAPLDAASVQLIDDFKVSGTLTIESGTLETMGHSIIFDGDIEINDGGVLLAAASSTIYPDNSSNINVNTGGLLQLYGEEGQAVNFDPGYLEYFNINIHSGGEISAEYTIFENMGINGLNIMEGATIDPLHPLDNCIFRNGAANASHLSIHNNQTLTIDGAEFTHWGGESYNVSKTNNAGRITFTNYSGNFVGAANENDPYNRIDWYEDGLEVTPANRNVSAAAGTTTFDLTSNVAWTVTENLAWLSVNPPAGSNNKVLVVDYTENTSSTPRSGEITISGTDVPDVIVTVNQAGANTVLDVTPANRNVNAAAGTTTFNLTSNVAWTVSESLAWLSVSPAAGSNNATLSVNFIQNTSIMPRSGNITISAAGAADVIVTVNQAGDDPVLVVMPANLNVNAAAGTTTFDLISNLTWSVSESLSWLSVSPAAGSNNASITVDYLENNTGLGRTGAITVSAAGVPDRIVNVTQSGEVPTLAVDPEFLDFLAPNGIGFLNVYSNTNWTITDNMDWLGLNLEFPSGNVVVSVSVSMNMTGAVRTGEITVETEDGSIQIIIPVTQQYFVEHIVSLPAGWSGLSSYALPTPPFIEGVFAGISDELIIALTEEEIYYPEYGVNTIGMWEAFSAYKIKTNEAVDLEIYGSTYPSKSMTIPTGWSLLPVISECPVDVEDLFAPVVSDIQIVKEVAGYGIYWPAMGINTLGTLNPGKAYYVLSTAEVQITFGDCAKSTSGTLTGFLTLSELVPWALTNPTASTHSIALPQLATQDFEKGSIIGAFDATDNCFGIISLDGTSNCLTIFGDDELTAEKDGFADGEQIFFRILKPSTKEEIELIPEFDFALPAYDGKFAEHGLSAITGFKAGSSGIAGLSIENIRVYPNPSNGTFNISGLSSSAEITITDVHGQLVFSKQSSSALQQIIDLQNCNPGIYMIGIMQKGNSSFHKLILK